MGADHVHRSQYSRVYLQENQPVEPAVPVAATGARRLPLQSPLTGRGLYRAGKDAPGARRPCRRRAMPSGTLVARRNPKELRRP
jgi:hypothetical protein